MEHNEETWDALGALSDGMAGVIERVGPAVVSVSGRRRRPASGVLYAPEMVLTTSHALEREEDISVGTHDGRTLEAQLVGRDLPSDLAVLRAEGLEEVAAPAEEPARVGQISLAVGRPEGPGGGSEVTLGVVSAVGGPLRTWRGARGVPRLESYVQTDAAPYRGLGGGALLDARGRVLGIVVAGLGRGTVAVPSEVAWRVARTLESRGSTRRGYLGVLSQPVRLPDAQRLGLEQRSGLLIASVEDDSPAGRGGALIGDILTALDGHPVEDTDDLLVLLADERVGREVPVQVIRGGEPKTLRITIGERS